MIVTRWAGHLPKRKLEAVLVFDESYLLDYVEFGCQITTGARASLLVNLIETSKAVAGNSEGEDLVGLPGLVLSGEHKEASRVIVPSAEFE